MKKLCSKHRTAARYLVRFFAAALSEITEHARLRNEYNVCDVGRYTIIQQRLCYIIIICLRFRFISSDSRVYRVANNHGHLFMYTNNNNILYIIFIYTICICMHVMRIGAQNTILYIIIYYIMILSNMNNTSTGTSIPLHSRVSSIT